MLQSLTEMVVNFDELFWGFARVLQSLTEMAIPVVLYLIISPPWKPSSNERPPVSQEGTKPDDKVVFISCKISSLDIGSKIVHPSKSAAFPTPKKSSFLRQISPIALAVCSNIVDE